MATTVKLPDGRRIDLDVDVAEIAAEDRGILQEFLSPPTNRIAARIDAERLEKTKEVFRKYTPEGYNKAHTEEGIAMNKIETLLNEIKDTWVPQLEAARKRRIGYQVVAEELGMPETTVPRYDPNQEPEPREIVVYRKGQEIFRVFYYLPTIPRSSP